MSLPQRARLRALIGALSLAGGVGLVPLATATGVPPTADAQCPQAAPVGEVTAGQAVDGLTVASGTTPETFTGTVLGTIADGIAPGLDLIVVRLTSPEIDRVGGIWEGMSGSPVYTADGRLVGAVSYGLAYGSSPVAGVTPADAMEALVGTGPATQVRPTRRVSLPDALARAATSAGTTSREAGSGLERLTVPVGVSGLADARIRRLAASHDLGGARVYRAAPAASAPASSGVTPVLAGGNLAASLSYGDFSAVGTGTTTLVCDGVVVGFGHPFDFTGSKSLTMHGASVVYVQEDPLGVPFKVSNPTGPVGVIDQDRMAGIRGELGHAPATALVRTAIRGPGGRSRVGETHVSVPDFLSTATAYGFLANADRVFDHTGGGSSYVRYAISGRTAAGRAFSVVHADRFASDVDISGDSIAEAAEAVDALEGNDFTGVSIDRVSIDATLSEEVLQYRVHRVQVKRHGVWRNVGPRTVLRVRHGRRIVMRVLLGSRRDELGSRTVITRLRVPSGAPRGAEGVVDVGAAGYSGGEDGDDEGSGTDTSGAGSFAQLLRSLQDAPRNDALVSSLSLFSDEDAGGSSTARTVTSVGSVVTGEASFGVRIR